MLVGQKMRLRQKRLGDAVNDYAWRKDLELSRLDAAPPLSISFKEYLTSYATELRQSSSQNRFAIETLDGKHIGNCAYFNINETEKGAELGIMVGDRGYWDKGYGADSIITLLNHIFSQTNLDRIYLKTLDWNVRAQKCFEKCGFTPCGKIISRGYNFLAMEIRRPSQAKARLKIGAGFRGGIS